MRHILIGGSGFLGTFMASELAEHGQTVIVADINRPDNTDTPYVRVDITQPASFQNLSLQSTDVVYHLAARLLVPIVPRASRSKYFHEVNLAGTKNVLEYMRWRSCRSLLFFTTDMVYGHTTDSPRTELHPIKPLGPYGSSKWAAEELCRAYQAYGINTTIFRPRLIIGPGRLGILERLFELIRRGLPVPTIGNGTNCYQFVSADDCVKAGRCAVAAGIPNETFNLGSKSPPTVRALLTELIQHAGSRSRLIPLPARPIKHALVTLDRIGLPLMDPEQFLIADEDCRLDITKAEKLLGWSPCDSDTAMLKAAYDDYIGSRMKHAAPRPLKSIRPWQAGSSTPATN